MRIDQLNLIRYGHFTERDLRFPETSTDFHVVYGDNEAGKSTARQALEDFLFGIPARTKFNFLHSYDDLQIGATIRHDGTTFTAVRHKGNANTLKNSDRSAIPDADRICSRYLSYSDRDFYIRMFSLDHRRLREGGESILDAGEDIGKAIFSASSGLSGLHEKLKSWEQEADLLWAPRKSKTRAFYIARDRFEQAQRDVRANSVSPKDWSDKQVALDSARSELSVVTTDINELRPQLRKIQRIARTKQGMNRLQSLERELIGLGNVTHMPEDSAERLSQLEQDTGLNENEIRSIQQRIRRFEERLSELSFDRNLLERRDEIGQLDELRIQLLKEANDLPKRKEELDEANQRILILASRIGWDVKNVQDVVERIPPRNQDELLRELITQHSSLNQELESTQRELKDANTRLSKARRDLHNIGEVVDLRRLRASIRSTQREFESIGSEPQRLQKKIDQCDREMELALNSLNPKSNDTELLRKVSVPTRQVIDEFRNSFRELDQNHQRFEAEIRSKTKKLCMRNKR